MDVTIITLEIKEKLEDAFIIEEVDAIEDALHKYIHKLCEEKREQLS